MSKDYTDKTECCTPKADPCEDEVPEDTGQEAQQFCDDWELQGLLINDEKLREQ